MENKEEYLEDLKLYAFRLIETEAANAKNRKIKLSVGESIVWFAPSELGYLAYILANKGLTQNFGLERGISFCNVSNGDIDTCNLSLGNINFIVKELRSLSNGIDCEAALSVKKLMGLKTEDEVIDFIEQIKNQNSKIVKSYLNMV